MKLVGTKQIIQAYLDHGGASMDEEHYQKYRTAMLNNWLIKYYWISMSNPDAMLCLACSAFFLTDDQDGATAHLKVHYPEMFDTNKPPRKAKEAKGGKA